MSYVDKSLTCRDCGRQFTFTSGEQDFYASRGLTHEPGRCPECRAARKAGGVDASGGYGDQGYSDRGYNDHGSYGERSGGYGGSRAPRQMYTAVCSSCGGEAQVPFQPTSGKPVYCSDCFAKQRAARF
jgi:CxxC-x17-CxxC domain-containing protein